MALEITVPELGESVTEATVAKWFKSAGDGIKRDEILVELETDKVNVEVTAEASGVLSEILAEEGETVEVGAVLGRLTEGEAPEKDSAEQKSDGDDGAEESEKSARPADDTPADEKDTEAEKSGDGRDSSSTDSHAALSPAVRKLVSEHDLDPAKIEGSGKDGRILKGDVLAALEKGEKTAKDKAKAPNGEAPKTEPAKAKPAPKKDQDERTRREPMSRLRQRIAQRLKQAQHNAAMLTTFNEVDMTDMMAVRKQYRDSFEQKHGVRLGFMSFFVKAAVAALAEQPAVNAEIDGTDIVYKDFFNIGVAVAAPNGLVVPVLRDADRMSFAEIEAGIGNFGQKARDGKLTLDDMTGGTFTISNGGVFGSLLSTPILNPPQSAILGMHKIQPRPMAVGDTVAVRQMMYLALSYDHRIIDGREAVTFLVRIKECIEDPHRLLLDV